MDGKLHAAGAGRRYGRPAPPASTERREIAEASAGALDIRAMSRQFEVSYRTLHYYEELELIRPLRDGRRRTYTRRDRLRLALILSLRRFGFLLEDIRQWLAICEREGEARQLEAWRTMAGAQIARLEEQSSKLDAAIMELRRLRETQVPLFDAEAPFAGPVGTGTSRPREGGMGEPETGDRV